MEGKEDLTIKISDEGGGIPRSAVSEHERFNRRHKLTLVLHALQMPQIWTYMYTTMSEAQDLDSVAQNDFKAPMAGFGYGLPLSRLVSLIGRLQVAFSAQADSARFCSMRDSLGAI